LTPLASSLHFIPASGSTIPIDWTHIPEASKKALTESYGYDWETDDFKPLLLVTSQKCSTSVKFFGYFDSNLLTTLMDISEFGLQAATPTGRSITQVGPCFYMKYLNQVWFLLFTQEKEIVSWDTVMISSGKKLITTVIKGQLMK
jgi:hypothetical protein